MFSWGKNGKTHFAIFPFVFFSDFLYKIKIDGQGRDFSFKVYFWGFMTLHIYIHSTYYLDQSITN